ncbi:hypothetical protein ILYODFUR_033624, partial [Ilyodon furcidens]
ERLSIFCIHHQPPGQTDSEFFRSEGFLQKKSNMIPVFFILLFVLVPSLTAVPLKAVDTNQTREDKDVTEALSKANAGIKTPLIFGDIAPTKNRNAVPCTATGCKWPKSGGFVYIPVQIGSEY